MSSTSRKCWLTFEGGCQDQPCIYQMSRQFPEVIFDVRQASVGQDIGVMALQFTGTEKDVQGAMDFLIDLGVKVDPIEGGGLVAG